jgi:hypothetical protein
VTFSGEARWRRGLELSSLILFVNLCGVLLWMILAFPPAGLTMAFISLVAVDWTRRRSVARRGAGRPLSMGEKIGFFLFYAVSVVEILLRLAALIVIAAAALLLLIKAAQAVMSWV